MQILTIDERPDKQERFKEIGFIFSEIEGETYWDERHPVEFTEAEIDILDNAATTCHTMAMSATKEIIENGTDEDLAALGIPQPLWDLIRSSWKLRDTTAPQLYGRFDFALTFENGVLVPKLYEYNADTPTSLFEGSIVQWQWLQDTFGESADQFNFIHERLVEHWANIAPNLRSVQQNLPTYFGCFPTKEDYSTTLYMAETAAEAGIEVAEVIDMREISISMDESQFLDERTEARPIRTIFKLYPWEFMSREVFMDTQATRNTQWIEAPWKLVTSSKGLLAKMYEMYPESPYLLKTRLLNSSVSDNFEGNPNFVVKPCLSREGKGVKIYKEGKLVSESEFSDFDTGLVIQEYCPSYKSEFGTIMSGVWIIGGVACGLGLRLDGDITGDEARFLPHYFI